MPILTPQERVGTIVADKYELTGVLGRGGMGVVYEALHRWTGRRVAIKLIDPALADDPELATRFLHEARAAARLRHPNVVDVLDMGRSDDGTVYQVLALLEGETLGARMKREGRLPWDEALALLAPIMDALEMAHGQGIVHRDVKPDNVFLKNGPQGPEPVLLDFGMAKLLDVRQVTTNSSAVFGTPHYMAPEQALGSTKVGPGADVWSVGVMLFECLSGELPFGRGPAAAYLARVVYEQAPSLAARCPELPPALTSLVDRALVRDATERFETMADLLAAVRAAALSLGVVLSDPRSGLSLVVKRPAPKKRSLYLVAGALAALAVVAGGFHTLRAAGKPVAEPRTQKSTSLASEPVQVEAQAPRTSANTPAAAPIVVTHEAPREAVSAPPVRDKPARTSARKPRGRSAPPARTEPGTRLDPLLTEEY